MLANKEPRGLIAAFAPFARTLQAVPVPGHEHHAPQALAAIATDLGLNARTAPDVGAALATIAARADPANPPAVLIVGTLYLAGMVLAANGQAPA